MRRDRQIWNLRSYPTCVCSWLCRMVVRSDLVALIPFDFPSDLTRGSLTRKGGNMKFCQDGFDSDRRNKFNHMHTRPKQTHTHTHTINCTSTLAHTHTLHFNTHTRSPTLTPARRDGRHKARGFPCTGARIKIKDFVQPSIRESAWPPLWSCACSGPQIGAEIQVIWRGQAQGLIGREGN